MNGTLDDLLNFYSDPTRWTQGCFARYADGTHCRENKDGYAFCLMGAMTHLNLSDSDFQKVIKLIFDKYRIDPLTYNDCKDRTIEDIRELIDEARKL